MRIVQIIDSLEMGGAERMAVNYANELCDKISFSGLVTTRKEGDLKLQLDNRVKYLFLNRKRTVDLNAVLKLRAYCKTYDIQFLQPHSSSYFSALLVKFIYPKVQIIWHDHNGLSEFLSSRKTIVLKVASFFFKGIIAVNYQLKNWAEKELYCKDVIYLPNFIINSAAVIGETSLKGEKGKRILCIANLRQQKNHLMLLNVAERLRLSHPGWSFHLVGKDFKDEYSRELKESILSKDLIEHVFLYGSRTDVANIISQSEIGILTSKSEGLPLALLEFGLNKKAVVMTNVGEIPLILKDKNNGLLVPINDDELFHSSLITLINNPVLRNQIGVALHTTIIEDHSANAVIDKYLSWLNR